MTGMPWGGSEELWCRAAQRLLSAGHQVSINYKWWPTSALPLQQLQSSGAAVHFRSLPATGWRRWWDSARGRLIDRDGAATYAWLSATRPDLLLITIGYHPDQIWVADQCRQLGIPYAINVQCASHSFFIHGTRVDDYRRWYLNARCVFFVSDENRCKLETNLAARLPNAEIVANPFNLSPGDPPEWPEPNEPFRLACVGRLHFQSKGQDLLLDVMRSAKWRARPLKLTFYGHDQGNLRQLLELIDLYQLGDSLHWGGFVPDVRSLWADNHLLVLPSRYEGAPLVVIEAMMCQRAVACTDVGRNRELIDEGISGFIADGAVASLVDDALERAWACRHRWREMGMAAARHIAQRYTADPVADFAQRLADVVQPVVDSIPGANTLAADMAPEISIPSSR